MSVRFHKSSDWSSSTHPPRQKPESFSRIDLLRGLLGGGDAEFLVHVANVGLDGFGTGVGVGGKFFPLIALGQDLADYLLPVSVGRRIPPSDASEPLEPSEKE
jgi:hypothetical protein